jgi:hypothetical protein
MIVHDDAADVGMVKDLILFEDPDALTPGPTVTGVVPHASLTRHSWGKLKLGLGYAVYNPEGLHNLISCHHLMQTYWFTKTEQAVHNYKHKELGHTLLFVKDSVLFPTAPLKFNCNIPRAALSRQVFNATYCQTSESAKVREIIDPSVLHSCDVYDVVSDFYQPPALPPIPEHLDTRAFRARLEAVRREHRNHNHKSWAQMRKSVDLGEIVGITRADIDNCTIQGMLRVHRVEAHQPLPVPLHARVVVRIRHCAR